MTNLGTLHSDFGVSPWLDNLSREIIQNGRLDEYISQGIRGITSNPSIFEKAFQSGFYNEAINILKHQSKSNEDIYWQLAIEDIRSACDKLLPVYESSNHIDGFVSLEVSPALARDGNATTEQALDLAVRVARPNLMIKIPATEECLPSIAEVLANGIHVNVTLIFSLHRYLQVINAYMSGLEKSANPSAIRSVASFFVSRVDSAVDPLLAPDSPLKGTAAVAQAQAAYGIYLQSFNENAERWQALTQRGAIPQRALWASTSTKDSSFPDLKYVNGLLARNSVNTLPDITIDAILDHADFLQQRSLNAEDIEIAHESLEALASAGINMQEISSQLEKEGVQKFQDAFSSMLDSIKS